ncbi:6-bladed beta-propeller [Acanthopleuribacter pedis]|uniref:6-bladed beta-propeller n=1 Tax=Acanthopleuribacter pedis TaxID=442870 RepID=A0A8J7QAM7_9BACT|nr:6-bladed beta-propeller [Acanthopleuribacter pedis]MBO1320559.1 6-bladed beta-propeller [Acanthopleuribacter pedis]
MRAMNLIPLSIFSKTHIFLIFFTTSVCLSTEPITTDTNLNKKLSHIKWLDDLFEFHSAFSMELTDETLFEYPKVTLRTESGYFVTNDKGDTLFRHHLDGRFDRIVARAGMGPEEILHVNFATHIYNNLVAFYDYHRSRILVYNESGDFQHAIELYRNTIEGKHPHMLGPGFAWPHEDYLILANVRYPTEPDIQGALFHVNRTQKGKVTSLSPIKKFTGRPTAVELEFGPTVISNFVKVGKHFWLGSPYFSQITIWDKDKEGNNTKEKPIDISNPLTLSDYEEYKKGKGESMMYLTNHKGTIHNMMVLPKMVLVKVGAMGWVPFDLHGRQLARHKILPRIAPIKSTYADFAVAVAPRQHLEKLQTYLKECFIRSSDHDTQDPDEPMMVLLRLREPYR